MESIFDTMTSAVKNADKIVLCDKDLTVIENRGVSRLKSGTSLADCFHPADSMRLQSMAAGKLPEGTELFVPILRMELYTCAAVRCVPLFGTRILLLFPFADRRDYLFSDCYKGGVMEELLLDDSFNGTLAQASSIIKAYRAMADETETDFPSIDSAKLLRLIAEELKTQFGFPKCTAEVKSSGTGFISGIDIDALIRIVISMIYVVQFASSGERIVLAANEHISEISAYTSHSRLPWYVSANDMSSLLTALPGCAVQLILMEITAARYGYEITCRTGNDSSFGIILSKSDDSLLTCFKCPILIEDFHFRLKTAFEEVIGLTSAKEVTPAKQ